MSQKRNIAGDKRAASLSLRPSKPQTNTFGRGFELNPPLTDMDYVEINRMDTCIRWRFGRKPKLNN